ncbi:MAG: sulfotransferase [Gammaproteobacteria bacterium]|nr:sulfotransferase [Gammaproteobacteria bacterium]
MHDSESEALLADIRQASQELKKGRRPDALLIYHDVKRRAGSRASVQHQLGCLCEEIGDIDQAISHYKIATDEAPEMPSYLATLGIAYLNAHELDNALDALQQAMALKPDMPDVLHGLGVYYMRRADYEQAADYLQRACKLKPSDANVRSNLASTLRELNRHDEALVHAQKAVKLDASEPGTHLALCNVLSETGRMDEAVRHLENTIRQHKDFGLAYDLLARIKKFSSADLAFINKTEKLLRRGMPAKQRYSLHFALGKMNDDCGRYDEAFSHYEQANLLRKIDYDVGIEVNLLKDMKKAFTAASVRSFASMGNDSPQPVFIVGMPRSGTTLMERIIASHPQGAGAGELPEMPRLGREIFPVEDRRRAAARARSELTASKIEGYANGYLNVLRQGRPEARRIVDKMPSNFYFVGLIKSIFPNATIIHAIRHPLDICLSCYFQNFSDLPWSNDFRSIGKVYSIYRDAMDYWHQVLPEGKILDVQYERLVEDPEHHARRMLDACGLEWDDIVLDFFRQKNVVRTASIAQTRMPIYKTSKMRWINYKSHLGELAQDLSEYLEGDRELLAEHDIELPEPTATGWLKRLLR